MNNDLLTAKSILLKNNYTCVLYFKGVEYNSNFRGVKPLIEFLETGVDFAEFSAADKVVGAGAAYLYVLLKVKALWANVISEKAVKILKENNIAVFYETKVPYIINRTGDGICPIENAVNGILNADEALKTIKQTIKKLKS